MSEPTSTSREAPLSAWFAGPKSENGEAFADVIRRILEDHHYWRRNYFPEDGVVITSETQRTHLSWNDRFQDRLLELLAALKADFPFQSPRYCAHMVAEQTLPSIAGYFAGMLYNPNNVAEAGLPAVCATLGSRPVLVVPETYHYCLDKIADVLGIGRRSIRTVAVDERFRMDPGDLRRVLEEIDAADEHVLAVVAVVGTTEEGSLDPVHEMLEVRTEREEGGRPSFWLHADAAYGGYLRTMMRPEPMDQGPARRTVSVRGRRIELELALPGEELYRPLERLGKCDSAVVDPHKLGYVPYPAGAVAYRSNLVRPVLRQDAPYLEEPPSDPEIETPMRAVPLTEPESNILCYAFRPQDGRPELGTLNRLNRRLYDRFSLSDEDRSHVYDQRFFVSRTHLSADRYPPETVGRLLEEMGVPEEAYRREGVFLLRSTLMNPWYGPARERGQHYLVELVQELYAEAEAEWNAL